MAKSGLKNHETLNSGNIASKNANSLSFLAVAATIVATMTACGTTTVDEPADGSGDSTNTEPITVTDYAGEEVTLPGPAQRVVALEWTSAENVALLGGELVGVADVSGYNAWASAAPIDEGITDVGLRTEPSLEAIGQANPDLIIGVDRSIPEGLRDDLEEIAPVVLQVQGDTEDPIGNMEHNFYMTADLLDAQDEADEVWSDLESAIEQSKEAIAEAGAEGTPFAMTAATIEGNTATFRMHGPGALAMTLGTELGLEPAWDDDGDPEYAISQSDVEGLTALPEDTVYYWWTVEGEPENPFEALESNSIWTGLGFVEEERMHPVQQIWIYGGPGSATQWVEYLAETISE